MRGCAGSRRRSCRAGRRSGTGSRASASGWRRSRAPAKKALVQAAGVELRQPVLRAPPTAAARRCSAAAGAGLAARSLQRVVEPAQREARRRRRRREERRPAARAAASPQSAAVAGVAQRAPAFLAGARAARPAGPAQRGVEPADLVVAARCRSHAASPAHRVAQQHAAQAEEPGVLRRRFGQAEAGAVLGVQAPADAGARDPAVQQRQVVLVRCRSARAAPAPRAGRARRSPRQRDCGRPSSSSSAPSSGSAAAVAAVGELEGDEARIVARRAGRTPPGCAARRRRCRAPSRSRRAGAASGRR